jgi:hypothetical protein
VSVLIVAKLYRNKFVLLNFSLVTASARIYVAFSFFGNAFKFVRAFVTFVTALAFGPVSCFVIFRYGFVRNSFRLVAARTLFKVSVGVVVIIEHVILGGSIVTALAN